MSASGLLDSNSKITFTTLLGRCCPLQTTKDKSTVQLTHCVRQQLLHVYPLDAVTKDGQPFWRLPKRPPVPLEYDPNDELCVSFVAVAAALRAKVNVMWRQPYCLPCYYVC
eukprot:COSAG01_NODE_116_length_25522_cov_187.094403_15_plen_111_part_00